MLSIKDKFRIWFMPTGWRPEDVIEKHPVPYTKDVYKQKKYYFNKLEEGCMFWESLVKVQKEFNYIDV